jgi:hypothetical protein
VKAILREAKIHDIKGIIKLAEKLLEYERDISGWKIVENKDELRQILFNIIGKSLMSPDCKIMVVDNSGRITGFFLLKVDYQCEVFVNKKFCNIWLVYNKTPALMKRMYVETVKWAKEKGCSFMRCTFAIGNKRAQETAERGFKFKSAIMLCDKEV